MYIKSIIISILIIFSGSGYAEQTDIINKLTEILSTINETKDLKDKSLEQDKQESKTASEQISEVVEKSEEFISNNIPQFNIPNFGAANKAGSELSTIRDPFNLSSPVGTQRSGGFNFGSSFLPNTNTSKVPELKLRGVIYPQSKKLEDLLALLEIDKKEVYMVRVGDEISYDPRNPNAAIKIINISRLTVTVQAGSLGNVLVVR